MGNVNTNIRIDELETFVNGLEGRVAQLEQSPAGMDAEVLWSGSLPETSYGIFIEDLDLINDYKFAYLMLKGVSGVQYAGTLVYTPTMTKNYPAYAVITGIDATTHEHVQQMVYLMQNNYGVQLIQNNGTAALSNVYLIGIK